MSKKDYYIIEKNINKIIRGSYTNFLDPSTSKKVTEKLKSINYNIYYPYKNSDKIIIYTYEVPKIRLLEIISYEKLTHREIMGSLFGLNIDSEMFGDIIITNNHYYIMVMASIYNLIINDYYTVGRHPVKLKEVDISVLEKYQRQYEQYKIITSSLRIDTVISKLIGASRDQVKKIIEAEEVILNYEPCHKINYVIKPNDIISIRRHGKFRYNEIVNTSKKGNYIISISKYVDN